MQKFLCGVDVIDRHLAERNYVVYQLLAPGVRCVLLESLSNFSVKVVYFHEEVLLPVFELLGLIEVAHKNRGYLLEQQLQLGHLLKQVLGLDLGDQAVAGVFGKELVGLVADFLQRSEEVGL